MKSDTQNLALFEDNPRDSSVLNPKDFINLIFRLKRKKKFSLPKVCLVCFQPSFYRILEKLTKPTVHAVPNENNPIHVFKLKGVPLSLVNASTGSFSATVLDEVIALGAKNIVFFGGVGVLDPAIPRGALLLPTKAIRDEGVSFHYEPPARYSYPSTALVNAVRSALKEEGVSFREGPCWTTDAPYRETFIKIKSFYKEGVLAVDMEAASFFSIAKHRKVRIAGIFSAGDFVGGKKWNPRRTLTTMAQYEMTREEFFNLVLSVAAKVYKAR